MAKKNPIASIQLPGFIGGLNKDADPYQLETNESPDCLNVDFGFRGAVSKRLGYEAVTTTQTDQVVRVVSWAKQGGSEFLMAVDDQGDIWDYTSTPIQENAGWSAPSGADDYLIGVAALGNKLYFTRVDEAPRSWDGTSCSSMTSTAFDGTGGRMAQAKFLLTAHSRMFAANVDDGGTRHRARLHFSDVLDAETWQAEDYIDFDPDDGQEITGIASFGEEIVVFKNHSVQLLAGKSEQSFSRFVVDSQLGTVSPYTIRSMGALLLFFDRDTGFWSFDGSGFDLVSDKINEYLLSGINYSQAYKASAFVHRTKLYLSVPWGTDTYNSRMFVWDQRTTAWSMYDFGVSDAVLYDGDIYAGHARNADGVQKLFSTLNDNGAAIDSYVYTPWLAPEGPEAKSRVRGLDLAFSALGNFDVDVDMYRDFDNSAPYRSQTVSTATGGATYGSATYGTSTYGLGADQVFTRSTGWGERFRTVQFRFGVNGVGDNFQLNKSTLHVSSLSRVRGEA